MWCYLKEDDKDHYLKQYPGLESFWEELVILKVNNTYFLPRLFYYNYPSKHLIQYTGKKQIEMANIDMTFTKTLRPAQKTAATKIEQLFKKQQFINGIIKLPPGTGKTVLTVYLASKLKLKTCIIIDSSSLLKQWISAFIEFSDLTEDDIGLIKQKFFITDKPVTIAMSQTLSSKLKNNFNKVMPLIDEAQFGLIVYDEVHSTSASQMYAKTNIFFRTINVLGLSATPFHTGLAEILMKNTIGEIIVESKQYELTPNYNLIHYNSKLNKYSYVLNKLNDYIAQKAFYNKILTESQVYLDLVIKIVMKLFHEKHKVIIICMTKKQVLIISQLLSQNGLINRRYTGEEKEIDKQNDNIIVATYSFVGKGFDMSRLSGLVLACPLSGKKSLIQVIGRVLRSHHEKIQPVVFDLIDTCFPLLSIPELKRKKSIVRSEFPNCNIKDYIEEEPI